jgi:putative peptide zinc metalloprotease protein
VLVPSGKEVHVGTPLIALSDRELDFEIEATIAQREETLAMRLRAQSLETADLEPIHKRLETIEAKLKDLKDQRAALVVRARQSGRWVAPSIQDLVGSWVHRGSQVGEIVHHGPFHFSAVVSQEEAADLFVGEIKKAEIRIYGQGGKNLAVTDYRIIPFQQEKLPSAALGWRGGGEVPVSVRDETGLQTTEPFFQIYADIESGQGVVLRHGRSGKLRFTLNSKPLLFQWTHKLRQLIQRRYQI